MPRNINLVRRSNQRGERPRVDRQRTPSPERPERERKPIPSGPDAGKLYVQKSAIDEEYWLPAAGSVLKFLFSFRVSAAVWSGISDCDETFNYWEPLHMFLFGDGFQTWEYSPVYAIRSYWYIYLHYMPATFLKTIFQSKVHLFIGIRIVLASLCMFAEYTLYKTLCNRISISIGRMFIFLSAVSAGMFISSAAFLPSSFSMVMNMLALAAYLNEKWFTAVFFTCFSAFVGWPFAAILGLPIALDMLLLRDGQTRMRFFIYSSVSAFLVGGSMIYCDSHYFGKLVFAPLNIVLYNVFSDRGPELYGIEPASYYAKNMLLNWNVAAPMCLIALPLAGIVYSQSFPAASSHRYRGLPVTLSYWRRLMPLALIYCSMIVWILIFFSTPHKEERFLFPIYPLIALFASVTIDAICRMFEHFAGPKASWPNATYLILAVFFVISMSRAVALYRNYSGSMETYRSFNEHFIVDHSTLDFSKRSQEPLRLCVGKEWYRFPSSFFLPQEVSDHFGRKRGVELRFLRSEFRGQLPKPWLKGRLPHVTRTVPTTMNDENREEIDRYVPLESCDYLIDLEVRGSTEFEPRYGEKKFLERMHTHQFLEPSKSHPVLRAFFVPYFNDRFNRYADYTLFRRTSPSIKR